MKTQMFKRVVILLICLMLFCTVGCTEKSSFLYWNEEAPALQSLTEYVKNVTDKDASTYIPVEDRIAVFDLDGTLYCETFPIYVEWLLFADYVLNTPGLALEEDIIAIAKELQGIKSASEIPNTMEQAHIYAHAKAFAGMPVDEYEKIVDAFKATNADGFTGMTRGEAFYLPMLEVITYLQENDFTVYICSGTNRFTVRSLIDGVIDIPPRQVIGTDFSIVAEGQGEETDMHYQYKTDEALLMGDTVITKNVKMSKVAQLSQELGQKPVLVFGNSTGDISMANYATADNPYQTAVFFLLCDDTIREYGNTEKATAIKTVCEENGWSTISMAEDFKTIYGEKVTVTP